MPTTSLDLADPGLVADPYPALAAERAAHPLAWHPESEQWLVFSHELVSAVQRDRRFGRLWQDRLVDGEPQSYLEPFNLLHRHQMMENEPPEHTRLRRPVARSFARGRLERLRPRVRELAARLLEEVRDAGPEGFDLISSYAEPLPVLVIAELLGVPGSHVGDLRRWSQAIVRMYEPSPGPAVVADAVSAAADFAGLVRELVRERRAHPRDDLVSDLAAGGHELTEDEIVASVVLLLNAGHEASVNVFGNGMVAMLRRGVRPEPGVEAVAVEEMLRFDSALQLFERTATEDVELGEPGSGVVVEEGQRVAVLLGAANRDPAAFETPDEMRLDRDPNPHVAFGVGVHFCLGAPLARMELAESLGLLIAAHPSLHLAGDPVSRGTFVLRGWASVPVRS